MAACSDDDSPWVHTPPATVPDGTEFTAGLSLAARSGFGASEWTGSGCERSGEIVTGNQRQFLTIGMWGPECVDPRALNGQGPRYNSLTDVVDADEVAAQRVTAGTAHVFEQVATICTNGCKDYTIRVVLIELDDPVAPEHPAVMIVTEPLYAAVSVDDLIAIADAIRTTP
ncbi:MAG: hypothetical protein ABMA25_09430 [Ilumatobacteraceae bacterium]